jgi:hypothetical protein
MANRPQPRRESGSEEQPSNQESLGSTRLAELRIKLARELTDELLNSIDANLDIPLTPAAREALAVAVFEYAVAVAFEAQERAFKEGLAEISQSELRQILAGRENNSSTLNNVVLSVGLALLLAPLTILINAITVSNPWWIPVSFVLAVIGYSMLRWVQRRTD